MPTTTDPTDLGFDPPPLDGMQDLPRMRFLFDSVLRHARPEAGAALEIGCYKGCSTVFLAMACRRLGFDRVTTVDLFTGTPSWGERIDTHDEAVRRFADHGLGDFVRAVRADSREVPWTEPLAVLHVDGDHDYAAVTADLARFAPLLSPGGIAVIDDYDSGHPGVVRAAHELLARRPDLAVVGVNNHRRYYGSICIRRVPESWPASG